MVASCASCGSYWGEMVYSLKIALLKKSLCLMSALQIQTSETCFAFIPIFIQKRRKKYSGTAAVHVVVAELKGSVMQELKFNKTSNSITLVSLDTREVFRKKIYMSGMLIFCMASYEIAVYPEMCQSQALDYFLEDTLSYT